MRKFESSQDMSFNSLHPTRSSVSRNFRCFGITKGKWNTANVLPTENLTKFHAWMVTVSIASFLWSFDDLNNFYVFSNRVEVRENWKTESSLGWGNCNTRHLITRRLQFCAMSSFFQAQFFMGYTWDWDCAAKWFKSCQFVQIFDWCWKLRKHTGHVSECEQPKTKT